MKPGIRTKLFAVALPAMLLPPLWIGFQGSRRELARARAEGRAAAFARVERAGERLQRTLRLLEEDLLLLARLPSITDFHAFWEIELHEEAEQHRQRMAEAVEEVARRQPGYRCVAILDRDLEVLASAGAEVPLHRCPPALPDGEAGAGPSGGGAEGAHWCVIRGAGSARRLARCRGLRDKWDIPLGMVRILIDMDWLARELDPRSRLEETLVLAHPDPRIPGIPLETGGRLGVPSDAELLALLERASRQPVVLSGAAGSFELFGVPALRSGWRVGLAIPSRVLYQGVERVRRQTLEQVVMALLAVLLLAAWLSNTLSGRIRELSAAADAFAEGNWTHRVPEEGEDELGQVAAAFNRMSDKVQETQNALRQRVEEVEKTRDQLVQAEKLSAVGTLASGIAHEIRSPLMTIAARASTLRLQARSDRLDPARMLKLADTLSREVHAANEIIQALQEYSRTSDSSNSLEHLDLREILDRALLLVKARRSSRRIALEISEVPPIMGDRNRLVQVVVNLLLNALDAAEEGPAKESVRVTLRTDRFEAAELERAARPDRRSPFGLQTDRPRPSPGEVAVRLEVEDRGPGIQEEDLARVVDPFYTTKIQGRGTGLGLSITLGIVATHGGLLILDSQTGRGTRVVVKLPAMEVRK